MKEGIRRKEGGRKREEEGKALGKNGEEERGGGWVS